MKNMVKLQAMLRIAGIIALTAVIVFAMAACEPEPEDNNGGGTKPITLQPADITITIKNSTTGIRAKKITGVKVFSGLGVDSDDNNLGLDELIGTINTYDTSYTVINGDSVTLPKVTVKPQKYIFGGDEGWFLVIYVSHENINGSSSYHDESNNMIAVSVLNNSDEKMPSAVTFDLVTQDDVRVDCSLELVAP